MPTETTPTTDQPDYETMGVDRSDDDADDEPARPDDSPQSAERKRKRDERTEPDGPDGPDEDDEHVKAVRGIEAGERSRVAAGGTPMIDIPIDATAAKKARTRAVGVNYDNEKIIETDHQMTQDAGAPNKPMTLEERLAAVERVRPSIPVGWLKVLDGPSRIDDSYIYPIGRDGDKWVYPTTWQWHHGRQVNDQIEWVPPATDEPATEPVEQPRKRGHLVVDDEADFAPVEMPMDHPWQKTWRYRGKQRFLAREKINMNALRFLATREHFFNYVERGLIPPFFDVRTCQHETDMEKNYQVMLAYYRSHESSLGVMEYEWSNGTPGRMYSITTSLQGVPRPIRHVLIDGIQRDVDAKACWVAFSIQFAEAMRIPCLQIKHYFAYRPELLAGYHVTCPQYSVEQLKTMFLKMLSGGKPYKELRRDPLVVAFRAEMVPIRIAMGAERPWPDCPTFMEMAVQRKSGGDVWNVEGSAFAGFCAYHENRITSACIEDSEEHEIVVGSGAFDGLTEHLLLLPQTGEIGSYEHECVFRTSPLDPGPRCAEKTAAVLTKTGWCIEYVEKPMTEALEIPRRLFPAPPDEGDYYWDDFVRKCHQTHFKSEARMMRFITTNFRRVCWQMNDSLERGYITRINAFEPFQQSTKVSPVTMRYVEKSIKKGKIVHDEKKASLWELILGIESLLSYKRVGFFPGVHVAPFGERMLNRWPGLKCEQRLYAPQARDQERLRRLLEFMLVFLCASDNDCYDYLIAWCYCLLVTPHLRSEHMILFFSYANRTMGKNVWCTFLQRHVVGRHLTTSITGITKLLHPDHGSHSNEKRLAIVSEVSLPAGKDYYSMQEALKTFLSEVDSSSRALYGEVKGIERYTEVMGSTNNDNALLIGEGDERIVVIQGMESKGVYAERLKYFKELCNDLDDHMGRIFFHYLQNLSRNALADLKRIPQTKARTKMIRMNEAPAAEFRRMIVERNEESSSGVDVLELILMPSTRNGVCPVVSFPFVQADEVEGVPFVALVDEYPRGGKALELPWGDLVATFLGWGLSKSVPKELLTETKMRKSFTPEPKRKFNKTYVSIP
jgi:hypothetical protein